MSNRVIFLLVLLAMTVLGMMALNIYSIRMSEIYIHDPDYDYPAQVKQECEAIYEGDCSFYTLPVAAVDGIYDAIQPYRRKP